MYHFFEQFEHVEGTTRPIPAMPLRRPFNKNNYVELVLKEIFFIIKSNCTYMVIITWLNLWFLGNMIVTIAPPIGAPTVDGTTCYLRVYGLFLLQTIDFIVGISC